jgi:hypothetical protein
LNIVVKERTQGLGNLHILASMVRFFKKKVKKLGIILLFLKIKFSTKNIVFEALDYSFFYKNNRKIC